MFAQGKSARITTIKMEGLTRGVANAQFTGVIRLQIV
jgi:hypothetical protein